ncbi:CdaR family protein [Shouchella shacheensis]|uniref:CdaR family protein n=1 Tax=Shouchella shacheensis TaxID=1649580 RepID=UPI00074055E0|nr:CdaR family protein [Shouchella shacheensis]
MDKLFNSRWFVRIMAFFIALMLFAAVNQENLGSPSLLPPANDVSYTLEDVELEVHYNEDRYELIDQPETVRVQLEGSQVALAIFQASFSQSYEVFVDATEETEGEHAIAIQTRGFPSDLTVSVVPQVARIELQEKETRSLPVRVELMNTDGIEEGYTEGSPVVTPVNVDVTAGRDIVEQVAEAKVFVDMDGASETVDDEYPVRLFNELGDEMELSPEPAFVNVNVPVTSPNTLVPVRMMREGEMPDGLAIDEVTIEPSEVTVYGPADELEEVEFVESEPVSLEEIEESGDVDVPLTVPDEMERVEPEEVTASVSVEDEEERTFPNVPITITGEGSNENVTFSEASTVTVTAYGSSARLERMNPSDIQAYADVSEEDNGEADVPIEFNGPSHIRFEAEENQVSLSIEESTP